jgi:predicted DNA-binding transcriptional regulator YafY
LRVPQEGTCRPNLTINTMERIDDPLNVVPWCQPALAALERWRSAMLPAGEVFCSAIASHRLVRISYSGAERVVEPYCHGVDKNGNESLRAYQLTSRDNKTGWRFFHLAKVESAEITEDAFEGDRPEYRRDDNQMRKVHCSI